MRSFVCRASLFAPRRQPPGCRPCTADCCALHAFLTSGRSIKSEATRDRFPIRQSLTCTSKHVVYVITCSKCHVQGVGETEDARARLPAYIRAARNSTENGSPPSCAIERHFWWPDHSTEDMSVQLVDKVPVTSTMHPAVIPSVRVRLGILWIHRLKASFIIRRNWRASFPGGPKRRRIM